MQHDRILWDKITLENGIIGEENCILCDYPKDKNDEKLIIYSSKYWKIIYNKFPYGSIKNHLLVFPKRHVELSKDLNIQELQDLKEIHNYIHDLYNGKKYFSFLREAFEGRSIKHLHYHYLPGNIHGSDFAKILNKQGH